VSSRHEDGKGTNGVRRLRPGDDGA